MNDRGRESQSQSLGGADRAATHRHLQSCPRCAREYRLFEMGRAALDLTAAAEPVRPDDDFFTALRAQIARGQTDERAAQTGDESWAAAVFLTARQLIPAMAVLLLLIIGATLLWKSAPTEKNMADLRPRERVLFNQLYDYPEPTPDDVLETLVAVEEKENAK
jgi:anti-sigma factor RsiW